MGTQDKLAQALRWWNEDPSDVVDYDAWVEEGVSLSKAALAAHEAEAGEFQARVEPWLLACFGEEIAADAIERNHRFLEEALELVQACGCTQSEAHQLVDDVFGRPVGEVQQEAGGVMVTLAALCRAQGISMHEAGETELARIWTKVEAIRAKQAAKPKHSPLPGPTAAHETEAQVVTCLSAQPNANRPHRPDDFCPDQRCGSVGGCMRALAQPAAKQAAPQPEAVQFPPEIKSAFDKADIAPSDSPESIFEEGWRAALAAQQAEVGDEPVVQRLENAASAALTAAYNAGKAAHKAGVYMPQIETGAELARAVIAVRAALAAQQVEPQHGDMAAEAGYRAAAGHLSALVDEAQKILVDLHQYAIDLQEDTLGGRSERGEVPIMDLAEDWLAARPDLEPQAPKQAEREPLSQAAQDVLAERQRQISVEGWTPEHDDEHRTGGMAIAAAAYALQVLPGVIASEVVAKIWHWTGWTRAWFKPSDDERNLVKAGALILAELERRHRARGIGKDGA